MVYILIKENGLNEKDGTVIIGRKVELKSRIGKRYFIEFVQTLEKLNEVLASPESKKYKEDIMEEANSNRMMARISGCGAATFAGFAHTGIFIGLMTAAGVGVQRDGLYVLPLAGYG